MEICLWGEIKANKKHPKQIWHLSRIIARALLVCSAEMFVPAFFTVNALIISRLFVVKGGRDKPEKLHLHISLERGW